MMMGTGLQPVYQDGYYMQQEEEWNREGLLDPAWEKQQKKVCYLSLRVSLYISHNDALSVSSVVVEQ